MQNLEELFESMAKVIDRYRKNKTMVAKEDLKGKYRKDFERLKQNLVKEIKVYVAACVYEGMLFPDNAEGRKVLDEISAYMMDSGFFKKVAEAAFLKFDSYEVKHLAQECHWNIYEQIWKPYFNRHTALYILPEHFNTSNPQTPEIYNDIVDKFYNEVEGLWITKPKPQGKALLLFVGETL